jgi:hypothetical protein
MILSFYLPFVVVGTLDIALRLLPVEADFLSGIGMIKYLRLLPNFTYVDVVDKHSF